MNQKHRGDDFGDIFETLKTNFNFKNFILVFLIF